MIAPDRFGGKGLQEGLQELCAHSSAIDGPRDMLSFAAKAVQVRHFRPAESRIR
jgi:hypothetical protein